MILVKCPNCKKEIEWSDKFPYRPFCSERCKLIDLGSWADGSYGIPTENTHDSDDANLISEDSYDPNESNESNESNN